MLSRRLSALVSGLMALAVVLPSASYARVDDGKRGGLPYPTAGVQDRAGSAPVGQTPPYSGDPVAPRPAPAGSGSATRFYAETGHSVSGDFLDFYKSTPNAAELFGLPLTEEFPQQLAGGAIFSVQYFERARFEYHADLPEGHGVGLGILSPTVLGNRAFDRLPSLPSTS